MLRASWRAHGDRLFHDLPCTFDHMRCRYCNLLSLPMLELYAPQANDQCNLNVRKMTISRQKKPNDQLSFHAMQNSIVTRHEKKNYLQNHLFIFQRKCVEEGKNASRSTRTICSFFSRRSSHEKCSRVVEVATGGSQVCAVTKSSTNKNSRKIMITAPLARKFAMSTISLASRDDNFNTRGKKMNQQNQKSPNKKDVNYVAETNKIAANCVMMHLPLGSVCLTWPLYGIITCEPGLESILLNEIRSLSVNNVSSIVIKSDGSKTRKRHCYRKSSSRRNNIEVKFSSMDQLMQCHLQLGTAQRILIRCPVVNTIKGRDGRKKSDCNRSEKHQRPMAAHFSFKARSLSELQKKISQMSIWSAMAPKDSLASSDRILIQSQQSHSKSSSTLCYIRASSSKSKLYHTGAIAERVGLGISDSLRQNFSLYGDGASIMSKSSAKCVLHDSFSQFGMHLVYIDVMVHFDEVELLLDSTSLLCKWHPSSYLDDGKGVADCQIPGSVAPAVPPLVPLHKRGYRLESTKAPLREDIAFALVYASGLPSDKIRAEDDNSKPKSLVVDPFCGSGTIVIEAASILIDSPPNYLKFQSPSESKNEESNHGEETSIASSSPDGATTTCSGELTKHAEGLGRRIPNITNTGNFRLIGSDRDAGAIRAATNNATRAGVDHLVDFYCMSMSESLQNAVDLATDFDCVYIITNPPFGIRTGSPRRNKQPGRGGDVDNLRLDRRDRSSRKTDLFPLYQTLGNYVNTINDSMGNKKTKCVLAVMAHDVMLAQQIGVRGGEMKSEFVTSHGGLPVTAFVFHKEPSLKTADKD